MKKSNLCLINALIVVMLFYGSIRATAQTSVEDPLPSWNESQAKKKIIGFVKAVTEEGGSEYKPPAQRIAVFDNDGTLWSEKPFYFQFFFALDRVRAMAPDHPEWKEQLPFKAVLENDMKALAACGEKGIQEIMMATHTGMTNSEFEDLVEKWVAEAKHPRFKRRFTDLVFQPMLELLAYLQVNGFRTYIISGGWIGFMRPWTGKVYGIPPEQVFGSCVKTVFEIKDGKPVLVRLAEMDFINDNTGKPIGINRFIGRRPIAAFGNSDGDLPMLKWTAAGQGLRLIIIVHHTDAEREWAYDRKSRVGRLDKALDEGRAKGWTIVDMEKDWKVIYPFQLE